jgi:hypothetical protein
MQKPTKERPPDAEMPTGPVTANVSDAIERAQYNEQGIAMTPIVTYEVGGQPIDKLLVSMKPGTGVGVHLHDHGGESQMALTPIRGIFGRPILNGDGGYELTDAPNPEDRKVKFEVTDNRIYTPDEVTAIKPGLVHGYGNPSNHDDAHIIFDLPHTHTTAEDKRLADDEVAALAEAIPDEEYEEYAGQQSLAIVQRKLGHLAHQHTPPHR